MNYEQALAGARIIVRNKQNEPVGYYTWFANTYVCLTCGHMCECNETDGE